MIRFTLILLACFSTTGLAAIPVAGYFEASNTCPAYISKDEPQTAEEYLYPSQRYVIKEINHQAPEWVRIQLHDNPNALRWVKAACGKSQYTVKKRIPCDNTPGLADHFVLALNWQPGFCETYGYEAGKPECYKLNPDSYQASHLALHGLWPNQKSCGSHYGYCGGSKKNKFCHYPPVSLSPQVSKRLKQLMPSFEHGSCLERHEWNRHGMCQMLSSDDYFSLAMDLVEQLNQTSFSNFLAKHVGEEVRLVDLQREFESAFGKGAKDKVYFGCTHGYLVDVYITLPALMPKGESLARLVQKAPVDLHRGGCSNRIKISDFYPE
ncbi:ribonuclease T2 family protein [Legionella impletisoli]|uniref:Ribonuclease T(2) n=1 Tax=Legionella impletisoli TaxID=343510 RepID=A0A917NCQ2_9GAMM|nr:ribonuclease T [Legionella impletisoli]GGI84722.1 ribonuclease T(2) [Legionella impletisoli]